VRLVDNAHAPAAELFNDAVVRNELTDERGRQWHRPQILEFLLKTSQSILSEGRSASQERKRNGRNRKHIPQEAANP